MARTPVHDRTSIEDLAMEYLMYQRDLNFEEGWNILQRMLRRLPEDRVLKAIEHVEQTLTMIGLWPKE